MMIHVKHLTQHNQVMTRWTNITGDSIGREEDYLFWDLHTLYYQAPRTASASAPIIQTPLENTQALLVRTAIFIQGERKHC